MSRDSQARLSRERTDGFLSPSKATGWHDAVRPVAVTSAATTSRQSKVPRAQPPWGPAHVRDAPGHSRRALPPPAPALHRPLIRLYRWRRPLEDRCNGYTTEHDEDQG